MISFVFYRYFSAFLVLSFLSLPCFAIPLTNGDIAFVGLDAGGNDDFAFVNFIDVGEGEQIFFTDTEHDGSGGLVVSEGTLQWMAPVGGVLAGTVIQITPATLSATMGSLVRSGNFALSTAGDSLAAYSGAFDFPSLFLTVINFDNPIPGNQNFGPLLGTGLAYGVDSIDFSVVAANHDFFEYSGPLNFTSAAFARAAINNTINWHTDSGGNLAGSNGIAPDLPFDSGSGLVFSLASVKPVPEPATVWLFGSLLPLLIWFRKGQKRWTHL